MKRIILPALLVSGLLMFASVAQAQHVWEVGVIGGQRLFEGEEDLQYGVNSNLDSGLLMTPAMEYGLRVGYHLDERWFLEGEGIGVRAMAFRPTPGQYTAEVTELQLRGGVGYNLAFWSVPRGQLTPLAVVQMGARYLSGGDFQQARPALSYGVGMRWTCNRFVARADVRHSLSTASVDLPLRNNLDFNLGIGYMFGSGAAVPCKPVAMTRELPPPPPPYVPPQPRPQPEPEPILVLHGAHFAFDSYKLTAGARGILEDVVDAMVANPNLVIEIGGHADSAGEADYNKALSLKRAKSAQQYLISRGILPARLKIAGYGSSQPVSTNETEEGRARNRRIVFRILSQ
jgi:outer membrane protein OmpA-like peptidoglycan-associated protein